MSQPAIFTAIDLGTDSCTTLIGSQASPTSPLQIVGVGVVPSRGMKKSQIIDLEEVLQTLSKSIEIAEQMAGVQITSASVTISGTHIDSQNSTGVVAVASPNQEITQQDVNRVIEAARAVSLPSDREIVHVIAKGYGVDSQTEIKDPIGMTGVRLESEAHIITALSPYLRNVEKSLENLRISVSDFVFSGLASAQVVLSETEKELGVAVIDIGAGSTSMCVYVDGALEHSCALPVGARHITLDIAHGCRVSFDVAEKLKVSLSDHAPEELTQYPGESKQDFNRRKKQADLIRIKDLTGQLTDDTVSRKMVIDRIMLPRVGELADLIKKELADHQLLSKIRAGVVLTGGGALTSHIDTIFKRELKTSARVGAPKQQQGLVSDILTPAFSSGIGALHMAAQKGEGHARSLGGFSLSQFGGPQGVVSTLKQVFQSLLP